MTATYSPVDPICAPCARRKQRFPTCKPHRHTLNFEKMTNQMSRLWTLLHIVLVEMRRTCTGPDILSGQSTTGYVGESPLASHKRSTFPWMLVNACCHECVDLHGTFVGWSIWPSMAWHDPTPSATVCSNKETDMTFSTSNCDAAALRVTTVSELQNWSATYLWHCSPCSESFGSGGNCHSTHSDCQIFLQTVQQSSYNILGNQRPPPLRGVSPVSLGNNVLPDVGDTEGS